MGDTLCLGNPQLAACCWGGARWGPARASNPPDGKDGDCLGCAIRTRAGPFTLKSTMLDERVPQPRDLRRGVMDSKSLAITPSSPRCPLRIRSNPGCGVASLLGGANVFEHWSMLSDSSTILSNKVEGTPTDSQLHATIP